MATTKSKKILGCKFNKKMSGFEKYLYAVRENDKLESDWLYKNRNNYFIKIYQKARDIFYHKYLN